MKTIKFLYTLMAFAAIILIIFSCEQEPVNDPPISQEFENGSKVQVHDLLLVANRESGTISIINAKTMKKVRQIKLPKSNAQPTYLAFSKKRNQLYVGDFATQSIWVYRAENFKLEGRIPIQKGAFHMWVNDRIDQLWVNNIISKTISVIDLNSYKALKTIALPTKKQIPRITKNAVQHDVVISPRGDRAFVTILDGPSRSYVAVYDTQTLRLRASAAVGGDAHTFISDNRLYVPVQNNNKIVVFDVSDGLKRVSALSLESAHGITANKDFLIVTGIQSNRIKVFNKKSGKAVENIKTQFNTPHNVTVNKDGTTLLVSHSDKQSMKSVLYRIAPTGKLKLSKIINTGKNPFGVVSVY